MSILEGNMFHKYVKKDAQLALILYSNVCYTFCNQYYHHLTLQFRSVIKVPSEDPFLMFQLTFTRQMQLGLQCCESLKNLNLVT